MKIKRSVLERITREEFVRRLGELLEASGAPTVIDANAAKRGKKPKGGEKSDIAPDGVTAAAKKGPTPEKAPDPKKPDEPKELPVADEPEADPELEKDVAGAEDPEDVTGGPIANELTGKTVQSLTMDPKSKILPGAQEITITFKEIPDPLKILITKQGLIKFFFRGGLHNTV